MGYHPERKGVLSMYKKLAAVWLLLCVLLLTGCQQTAYLPETDIAETVSTESIAVPETEFSETETIASETNEPETEAVISDTEVLETEAQSYPAPEDETLLPSVEKDGSYTSPEDVAEYIHTFGTLPDNFITKKEAQALGWVSSEGNLWDVAPEKSIGGDYFGNREGLLPEGNYHECDVNYTGGYRGSERIIYGDDGSIWYTNDHYQSFEQLY